MGGISISSLAQKRSTLPVEEFGYIQLLALTAHHTDQLLHVSLEDLQVAHAAFDELWPEEGAAV